MSIMKLFTALRGRTNEVVESMVDTQSLRILDQEIRDAKEELRTSDQNLVKIMAKEELAKNKVKALENSIAEYSDQAVKAMELKEEALALECAERVSELETELETEKSIAEGFSQSSITLKANIKQAKANVRRMEQQIDQIKATESVQKAQVAVSKHHLGANSRVKTALDSMERIKQKQVERDAEMKAAERMAAEDGSSSLDEKLKQVGIKPGRQKSGADKLAQLMAKKETA